MKKPEPVSKSVVCSVCGLDWERHLKGAPTKEWKPSLETCVELLKIELAKNPRVVWTQAGSMTGAAPFYGTTAGTNPAI